MLSGIKTGKKKKKQQQQQQQQQNRPSSEEEKKKNATSSSNARTIGVVASPPSAAAMSKATSSTTSNNELMAEALRQQLLNPLSSTSNVVLPPTLALGGGDRRPLPASFTAASVSSSQLSKKDPSEWTVQEMLVQEKSSTGLSYSEQQARNVLRMDKKRKLKSNEDSDEEEERLKRHVQEESETQTTKAMKRWEHRQYAAFDQQSQILNKCWWWIESPKFRKHLVISVGQYVTLLMTPPNVSIKEQKHFWLVPIPHADAFVNCDDNTVWNEIRMYQKSLHDYFLHGKKKRYRMIYFETVLSGAGNNNFWQTKLEAVALPIKDWYDAPLFFQQSMNEKAQELHGTHQKLIKTNASKPLYNAIPKQKGFDYFYVEYDDNPTKHEGYVQMIESRDEHASWKDFGVDTIAGMTGADPIRFKRKQPQKDIGQEQAMVRDFQKRFQSYDWTITTTKQATTIATTKKETK